ncbi:acyl-CoA N-acyltransferase [Macrolepiota fuliginosa MF-IS2]|uniref:N-alpha-acetyltransferase 40 n=1 Tax=Macrolepiota fuliginosa MF-IS2 TaxID=1400762 RepID=A0A9P5XR12_9AGAR|nr:acyl-CoA N-acyltransferase [Macrolepiota fuliginosa MF-IS2]
MSRRSGRVRQALNIELMMSNRPSIKIARSPELEENEKTAIWNLFEANMFDLYSNSSFGWKPTKRKKEIFHQLSRFLVVYDSEEENEIVAFCMFRFENEEGENVVYCYDIQISPQYRRNGIGKGLIEVLATIGMAFNMEKIVLTVLKANTRALAFYQACGFVIDPASPSLYLPADDPSRKDYDYEIMSRDIGA